MNVFLLSILCLVLGYLIYGRIVEKVFGACEERPTPALKYNDGVDYMPLPLWKIFLIQFLNIAGLGPVFGAVLGAVYGPVCFLWIVLGSIFAGGVHDYLSGMFSVRYKGKTLNFLVQKTLTKKLYPLFAFFIVFILLLVGAVFALNPAKMLANTFSTPLLFWCVIIFGYYFLTTVLSVDKIIGKFYPFFALLLIFVTFSLFVCLLTAGNNAFPTITFENLHPKQAPIFPLMFITIACGAISGFHATQSPIMARCLPKETDGRKVFYGAMILEGFIALVWANLGMVFYNNSADLLSAISKLGQGGVVAEVSKCFLGHFGSVLTVLSVVVLSITSGDTAFRSARLTIAEFFKLDQKNVLKRFGLSVIILSIGILFTLIDITTLWMYFGWANQTLSVITLWSLSIYLKKKKHFYWISLLPAMFMTNVCFTYILYDKIGFKLPLTTAKTVSVIFSICMLALFFVQTHKKTLKNTKLQNSSDCDIISSR